MGGRVAVRRECERDHPEPGQREQHAETLGAALSHGSLNIGNALGAWLGGVTIAAGFGYRSPLVIGAVLSLAGFAVLAVALWTERSAHSSAVTS